MAYQDAIKYNAVKSMRGLPIGSIVAWTSDQSSIPTGWILCSGATISVNTYPLLFDVIGNSYGGTVGSTFRIPPLTNSIKGIVDIFRGHYGYLKSFGDAHSPQTSTISEDPFWTIVGGGQNQDSGSSSQSTWISTIDVVGEFADRPDMFAIYDDIEMVNGEYSFTISFSDETLTFNSLQPHSHSLETDLEAPSWRRGGHGADGCFGTTTDGTACRLNCDDSSQVTRVARPAAATEYYANVQTNLDLVFDGPANSGYSGSGGGGDVIATTAAGQTSARIYSGGDGIVNGNVMFSSLSNTGPVAAHTHGPVTFNLTSRIGVISPGLRSDISMHTVAINNESGRDFCTLTANTSTPYLELSYIIRAF